MTNKPSGLMAAFGSMIDNVLFAVFLISSAATIYIFCVAVYYLAQANAL